MRKITALALAMALVLTLALSAACDRGGDTADAPDGSAALTPSPIPAPDPPDDPTPELPFRGKIAIITNDRACNEEEYLSAAYVAEKYGVHKITHKVWPITYTNDEQMINIILEIAADPDIRAVVINQAVINTNTAVDKLLDSRPDMFVAYCQPAEYPHEVVKRAYLSMTDNNQLRSETIVMQANAMGAEVFAHYSYPMHMDIPSLSQRREAMKTACDREGLEYVDLLVPDPYGEGSIPHTQQLILEDVPKQVAKYGKNTAFFGTSCYVQIPLIIKVIDEGAIYPEPCCPSPFHGFPPALGIAAKVFDGYNMVTNDDWDTEVDEGRLKTLYEFIRDIRSVVATRGATGRLATWPVPTNMMFTAVATEYAIKWINGEVPQEKDTVDYGVIAELCEAYIYENTGEHLGVELNPLSLNGRVYNSYLLVLPDSIVF